MCELAIYPVVLFGSIDLWQPSCLLHHTIQAPHRMIHALHRTIHSQQDPWIVPTNGNA
jgi:hypothetical protein